MRLILTTCIYLALTFSAAAQLIINGNGNGGFGPIHPGYISGDWYLLGYPGLNGVNGAAPGANVVVCDSAYVPLPVTIKTLGASVTSTTAASHVSLAIYTNTNSRPGTLIDYAATALASVGGAVTGALTNTTDTLSAGFYWVCYTFDAAGPALLSIPTNTVAFTMPWLIGSATQASINNFSAVVVALKCTVSSTTCGGTGSGWGVWSGSTFTWGDATSNTWTDALTSIGPLIQMQVN